MVSAAPAPAVSGATQNPGPETARSLRLLWDHGQRLVVAVVPGRRDSHLEEMAGAPPTAWLSLLGDLRSAVAAVYAAAGRGRSLSVPSGKRARDLTSRMP